MTKDSVKQLNILVIDDEPFILKLAVRVLNQLGYESVATANNGKVAVAKLVTVQKPFDMIICDLNMPEMDGVEFIRHANTAQYKGGIIFLSGEDERILETAYELGVTQDLNILGAIPKPLNPNALQELLANYDPSARKKQPISIPTAITEEELKEGIRSPYSDKLLLVYQPKVEIQTGEITGVETLCRWKHRDRGLLGPDTFIPVAEETGLIDELTKSIYRKAVDQVSNWLSDGLAFRTSVNFSINSFANEELSKFILSTTNEFDVDPSRLVLEVTETQVMDSTVKCMEILTRLRMKKFGLSIDDFGSGNSSMAQLKSIPFSELKVDRAFVHKAATNPRARAVLEASVNLAKSLKMEVVAEGGETREDWDLAESLGVDYMQGFYCAKPMPDEELREFLKTWTGPH
ncbi:MAG: hypothetical protein COB20_02685 [SAR86 cluster bacterium]|uniref:Diguanylate phosphodiesterase n=1 Tax=SAR86 cluster bacterium TaxID=2030880 RepID=A0A2A4XDX9_9GAMM|nr:MAG: hypothetical protein COB20_02685 [SAR86 cluster bacterium]